MGGFTTVVREEAVRLALKDCVVLLFDRVDLVEAAGSATPEMIFLEKYQELMSEIENDERILGY